MKKILIIDDEQDLLNASKIYLEQAGYQVFTAENGIEGLKLAHSKQPDLILLDINMPEYDGYSIFHKLKDDKKTANIPIFILTASEILKEAEMFFKLGVQGYLMKRWETERWIKKIEAVLEGQVKG